MREPVLVVLRESPARIARITADLTPAALQKSPAPGAWSANEVLAHLRSCADVWGGYIRRLIDEEEPTIRAISPRGWIRRTNYLELEFQSSFRAFESQRADLVSLLESLPPRDWSRAARVTRSGRIVSETVLSLAERLAEHENHHLEQFTRIAQAVRE